MNYEAIKESTLLSEKIPFPETLARLTAANVELYYADLLISTKTYYSKNEAFAVPFSLKSEKAIGAVFKADHICTNTPESIRANLLSGIFKTNNGRKAIYFGKLGEQHVEHFPDPE
ncbi:MAG: hypothetical protein H0V82_00880 [Candidatus Protochlamydia sp.]|nr:hypothetical protein [Candidatus Protochlamydia sp.]